MKPDLERWATQGLFFDCLLATQTQAAFDEYHRVTGCSKQALAAQFSRPLRAYKEPSRAFVTALTEMAARHKYEEWRLWGAFMLARELTATSGDRDLCSIATQWGIPGDTLADIYFAILGRIQDFVRVEQRADGAYVCMDRLTVRLGHTSLAPFIGVVNDFTKAA